MAASDKSNSPRPSATRPSASRPDRRPILVDAADPTTQTVKFEDEQLGNKDFAKSIQREAPAWLVSMIFHLILLVIIGLIVIPQHYTEPIILEATYAETLGEQLEIESLQFDQPAFETSDPVTVPDAIEESSMFDAMPELRESPDATSVLVKETSPEHGNALDGRKEGMKKVLLARYGGSASTEEAVLLGLKWLAKNQGRDGLWSLKGPYTDGGNLENKSAATAMALLAFQGAGNTTQDGPFKANVKRGWAALLKRQKRSGDFYQTDDNQGPVPSHHLYTHAQGMIAICELYGMTGDESFRDPAQRAVKFAESAQSPLGGWRYRPGGDSDLSVTGWFVMGLQSAKMAGLEVDQQVLDNVENFLITVQLEGGRLYGYRNGYEESNAMTAEGLLCREYLGWKSDDNRLLEGLNYLNRTPIDWNEKDFYFWYYAAQCLHHIGGKPWDKWNGVMRQSIPENQNKTGREIGSWDWHGDRHSVHGGRLYSTCMCIYMLEVYYRHLPIYNVDLN